MWHRVVSTEKSWTVVFVPTLSCSMDKILLQQVEESYTIKELPIRIIPGKVLNVGRIDGGFIVIRVKVRRRDLPKKWQQENRLHQLETSNTIHVSPKEVRCYSCQFIEENQKKFIILELNENDVPICRTKKQDKNKVPTLSECIKKVFRWKVLFPF